MTWNKLCPLHKYGDVRNVLIVAKRINKPGYK